MQKIYKILKVRGRALNSLLLRLLFPKRKKAIINKKRARAIKKAEQGAIELDRKLNVLGFTERATVDLNKKVNSPKYIYKKRPFARVLANWHANRAFFKTEADAKHSEAEKCLKAIELVLKGEKNRKLINEAAIMKAECYRLLGDIEAGKKTIAKALKQRSDVSLYLAAANFEVTMPDRLKWVNRALGLYKIPPIAFDPTSGLTSFDCLKPGTTLRVDNTQNIEATPKVTVIITVYNAEKTIKTAMDSILGQSWSNLEVLVVDDCSCDGTANLIKKYSCKDDRVRLIKTEKNFGTFVARNIALREATGLFVTCHDADDWAHPQRIEKQALHLMQNPSVIGNISQHVRATSDFEICRRGTYGRLIYRNISSFMFLREPVMKSIGYWDCVRLRADAEYIRRIRKVFGNNSVIYLDTGPLAIVRLHSSSLTGNKYFGKHGYLRGILKHYVELQEYYHEKTDNLYYEFPQISRLFPVPEPMWPQREYTETGRRHFDIIVATDFRLKESSTINCVEEIKVQKKMGIKTGLVQLARYDQNSKLKINSKVLDLLDGDKVQMIVYGEKVTCKSLIVRHPPVLQERQIFIPDIIANKVNVVIDQVPGHNGEPSGAAVYDLEKFRKNLLEYFGQEGTWYVSDSLVRENLYKYYAEQLKFINLSAEYWVNIIDVDEWRSYEKRLTSYKTKIGRHSRKQDNNWPADLQELFAVYPNSNKYEVHLLGGVKKIKRLVGSVPKHWNLMEFDSMSLKAFLSDLDVFVYYTKRERIKALDWEIIEAMAVGLPVITLPIYQNIYGNAAVYAEPASVKSAIDELVNNKEKYLFQVEVAQKFVKDNFGCQKHEQRINEQISCVE